MKHKAGFFIGLLWSCAVFAQQPSASLEQGNVRFHVQNAGVLFQNNGNPGFEVPKGSGVHSILSSSFWVGGKDSLGNTYVSIATYDTSGRDFIPGPLDRTTAQPDDSSYWNFAWHVDSTAIANHQTLYNNTGYTAPWAIRNWPGSNKRPGNYNPVLAPFFDINNNFIYEPELGEIPQISGTEAAYIIYNDQRTHQVSGSNAMGLEVLCMVYTVPEMPDVVFVKYRIINRMPKTYEGVFAGVFTDFMLGKPDDNYTSSDSLRSTYYCYNALPFDSNGYEDKPPVMGVKFLSTKMSRCIGFDYDPNSPQGWPQKKEDYYNYLNATWKDGSGLMDPNSPQTSFLYLGNPCNGSGWTEYGSAGIIPGRRNMLGSVGPFTLKQGEVVSLDLAYIFTQDKSDLQENVCSFHQDADDVQAYWDAKLSSTAIKPSKQGLKVYPNPARTRVFWDFPEGIVVQQIDLINMQGSRIALDPTSTSLEVGGLEAGIYLIQARDALGQVYQAKVAVLP